MPATDLLTVEPLDAEVLAWLGSRLSVQMAPELAQDPAAFREALSQARAAIVPPSVAIDRATLLRAPRLRVLGRLAAAADNIDLDACARAGVEVVRPAMANAPAEAEFVIAALLQMLRRVPVITPEGLLVGRELSGSTIGVVGMTPAVRPLALLLEAFGARLLGYDPALHASDATWSRLRIEPVSLRDLMRDCDGVCVLLSYFPRYAGLFGERVLAGCKRDQVLVSLAHPALFNEVALARTLRDGPLAAAWFDQLDPAMQELGRPLCHIDTLQVTPRVSGITRQSRTRSAWALAQRIHERLQEDDRSGAPVSSVLRPARPAAATGLAGDPASA